MKLKKTGFAPVDGDCCLRRCEEEEDGGGGWGGGLCGLRLDLGAVAGVTWAVDWGADAGGRFAFI